ncbi:T9SS C-terminal target domain-containing protein [Chryseobacterium sp. H3056]|uniref:T9SS C-terminal target domain-containing protein n=1 Tax=Kaistella daneshvariae TaxID=2487074 RepID=A0A3N0WVU6_9FLAO|nr:T9SS type A sorting domain-containing protein [Kaistella daneshvariae]ROI09206.1 T9SS C-terminal target domain-containing protein [Kaistella daneshvariae]
MKSKFIFFKEFTIRENLVLSLIFTCFFVLSSAQNNGDYRSKAQVTGTTYIWRNAATWEIYDGPAGIWKAATTYPGFPGTTGDYAVTILPTHNVAVQDATSPSSFGDLIVKGTLNIAYSNATWSLTSTYNLIVDGSGAIVTWSGNKGVLAFPAEAGVVLKNGGNLDASKCTGNSEFTIGSTSYKCPSFDSVIANGGTLVSVPVADLYTICKGGIINFSGSAQIGVVTQSATYSWNVTPAPSSIISGSLTTSSFSAQFQTEGTYDVQLRVTSGGKTVRKNIKIYVGGVRKWLGTSWDKDASVPARESVVINGSYDMPSVAVGSGMEVCNCTVNSGATFTVPAQKFVRVKDNIVNNGTITVKNGGNLLQVNPSKEIYSGSGIFKAEGPENMALENGTVNMDYVYWSSPVAGQNIAAFSPGTPTRNLLQYTEKTDYFATTPDAVFKPAKGYALRAETTGVATGVYTKTYVFTGAPNNGFFGAAVTKTGNGYNLVGNPYPSAINFDILQANNAALIDGILYRWNNKVDTPPVQQGSAYDQSNYVTYSSLGGENPSLSGNIAVGMGFIVRSKASGTLNFENAYTNGQQLRVATAATFYKKEVSAKNRFWLALTSPENLYKTQLIGYVEGASDGLDRDFDAPLLSMGANQFFSLLDDNGLVIQGKSENFEMSDKIILGANIASKGKYSISLMQPEGIFASAQKVYLKDNKLNTITDLTAGSYSFDGEVGISESRFEIVYQTAALGTGDMAKSDLVVYKNGNNFLVKGGKKMKSVEVFDASGRMVNVTPASSETVEISADTFLSGLYVLSIKYEDGTMKTKKVIK